MTRKAVGHGRQRTNKLWYHFSRNDRADLKSVSTSMLFSSANSRCRPISLNFLLITFSLPANTPVNTAASTWTPLAPSPKYSLMIPPAPSRPSNSQNASSATQWMRSVPAMSATCGERGDEVCREKAIKTDRRSAFPVEYGPAKTEWSAKTLMALVKDRVTSIRRDSRGDLRFHSWIQIGLIGQQFSVLARQALAAVCSQHPSPHFAPERSWNAGLERQLPDLLGNGSTSR